jgi:hypothetical protein
MVAPRRACSLAFAIGLAGITGTSVAGAEEPATTVTPIEAEARRYYDDEVTASFLFGALGGVTALTGALALTQSGDFARGYGFSSLIAGGVTLVGAVGYAIAAKSRGSYFGGLASTDVARFKQEESEHIGGTASRFWLYLGTELLIAAAGLGAMTYGVAAKNDLWRGIGAGVAIQGIGLFVIDVPGSMRASRYHDAVLRFDPGRTVKEPGG